MPVILGVAALLLALAGIGIQQWLAVRQAGHYQAEIEALAAQIDTTNDMLARAQADILVMKTSQDELASRLAGFEDALPQDPAEALAALAARLDTMAADLESRPADTVPPQFESGLVLAQAGLGAATAMNAANLEGGDPARWLPVLRELALAGLDVGGLSRLEALLTPPPVPTVRLLAEGSGLVAGIDRDRGGVSGWWQDTTGMIAGFIRLRRSDDAPTAAEGAAEAATPADDFARALRAGSLAEALAASRRITAGHEGLADWQLQSQRRLDLDAVLAALMARMTARLVTAGAAD